MEKKSALRKTRVVVFFVFLIASLSLGCARHKHVVVHPAGAKVVVIKKGHVHSNRCGHYRYNGKWYFVKGHVHKKRCGHAHVKGVWVIKK